jgi:dTDP-4-dehydrorhamnose reductase
LGALLTRKADGDPPAGFQANVAGTFHVLEAARLFEVKQVLFSSSIGSYGPDVQGKVVDDYTIQRPVSMYGASKLFGESLGRFYRERYGLDFRCLRYPGIFGPGFRTTSMAQPFSLMVEESVMSRPYTLRMAPDVRHALLYYKDAALAILSPSCVNILSDTFNPPLHSRRLRGSITPYSFLPLITDPIISCLLCLLNSLARRPPPADRISSAATRICILHEAF